MAGLAANADLRKGCGEMLRHRIVVLMHARRMAFGTHEIPILVQLGPVQEIVVTDLLIRIEVKPALTTPILGSAVPSERQGLQATVWKFDQVLLQRIDAEGVFHLERCKFAIRAVGFDQKRPIVAEKARAHAKVVKGYAGKVA